MTLTRLQKRVVQERSTAERRQMRNNAEQSLRNLGHVFTGSGTTRATLVSTDATYARRAQNLREAAARRRTELQSAGPSNGRTWVRGFYRQTPRGGRVWVRGHWTND